MKINIPPVTRVLLLLTLCLSFLYTVARWSPAIHSTPDEDVPTRPLVPYLTLVPARCLYYPWTLLSSTFVEQNIVNLLINGAAVYFGGRYLERAWGSQGLGVVVLIAAIIPNLLIVPTYIIWGSIMGNTTRADTPITGAITLQAAFMVAFKQLVPEHTVSVYKGVIKMRVKHFPAIFLLLNTLSGIILGTDTALLLAWYGLVTTWVYLRFFKIQPDLSGMSTGSLKGDASETFAFATFFPDVMQPPIAAICDQMYIQLCKLKILKPFSDEAIANSNEQASARGEGSLPSILDSSRSARQMSKREEAERRRALALKALDQRLSAANSQSVVNSTAGLSGSVSGSNEVPPVSKADEA